MRTGYVNDRDKLALLSGATVLAYPSLYEGFGFPVLEAFAAGVPVMTSNVSSLPEVAGEAAVLVDPADVDAIATALSELVADEDLRAVLSAAGVARASRFTWEATARATAAVLREAAAVTAPGRAPDQGHGRLPSFPVPPRGPAMAPDTNVLVTGGAGFIGSHLVDALLERPSTTVTVLDRLSTGGSRANLEAHDGDPRLRFVLGDVVDAELVDGLVADADSVIHAAAESHVDRSIDDPGSFLRTNVIGTQVVLEAARSARRAHADALDRRGLRAGRSRTTSVFDETHPLEPASPYAASKAAADLLCSAYVVTYGAPGDDRPRHERVRTTSDRARDADVLDLRARGAARPRLRRGAGSGASSSSSPTGSAPRSRCSSTASPAASTTSAAGTNWRTSSWRDGSARWPACPSRRSRSSPIAPVTTSGTGCGADRLRASAGSRGCRSTTGSRAPSSGTAITSPGSDDAHDVPVVTEPRAAGAGAMRLVVTGAAGGLGRAFLRAVPTHHQVHAFTHDELDVGDRDAVMQTIPLLRPDAVLHSRGVAPRWTHARRIRRAPLVTTRSGRNTSRSPRVRAGPRSCTCRPTTSSTA